MRGGERPGPESGAQQSGTADSLAHRLDPDKAAAGAPEGRPDAEQAAPGVREGRPDAEQAAPDHMERRVGADRTTPRPVEGGVQTDRAVEHRLDPDRAAAVAAARGTKTPPLAIDTRPYRRAIGAFAFGLVVVISIVLFLTRGVGTVGVAPGQRLHNFAAPVATSNLVGDPNFSKPCQLGYFGKRALNTCLLTRRSPLVLTFFVTGSTACVHEVDTVQQVSRQFSPSKVAFAAVAVSAPKGGTARLVRSHRWSIPVAYDRDGSVGSVYGVAICPLVELVNRGGVVKYRLIGERWLQPAALAAKVRALVG